MATSWFHRRDLLKLFGAGSAALVLGRVNCADAQVSSQPAGPLPAFTGPEANPYWNGVNPFVTYPQKLPLLRLTDRGIQLETPRQYFDRAFTPNPAFYVRYHLELIPNSVDLGTWRLHLEGNFDKPMLNGFPLRLVVPGIFSTYWIKHLTWIRALTQEDQNFWMDPAYRIPDTPRGNTTPDDVAAGKANFVPIGRVKMPVRSFIVTPDGSGKLPVGLPVVVQGIAFSGDGPATKVEVSADDGKTWAQASLGEDHGPYSFRTWQYTWTPRAPGKYLLAVRATDAKGHVQSDEGVWNPGGYLWNKVERQDVIVGSTS